MNRKSTQEQNDGEPEKPPKRRYKARKPKSDLSKSPVQKRTTTGRRKAAVDAGRKITASIKKKGSDQVNIKIQVKSKQKVISSTPESTMLTSKRKREHPINNEEVNDSEEESSPQVEKRVKVELPPVILEEIDLCEPEENLKVEDNNAEDEEEECLIKIVNISSLQEPPSPKTSMPTPTSQPQPSPPPIQDAREAEKPIQPSSVEKSWRYFSKNPDVSRKASAQKNQNPRPAIAFSVAPSIAPPPQQLLNPYDPRRLSRTRTNHAGGMPSYIPFGGRGRTTTLGCGLVIPVEKVDGFQQITTNNSSTKYQLKKIIYVSNMSTQCNSKCVYYIFNTYGNIRDIQFARNGPNNGAHALVTFQRPCDAKKAMRKAGIDHFDRRLNVSPHEPQRNTKDSSVIPQLPRMRTSTTHNTANPALPQVSWLDPRQNVSESSHRHHNQTQSHPPVSWSNPTNYFTMQHASNQNMANRMPNNWSQMATIGESGYMTPGQTPSYSLPQFQIPQTSANLQMPQYPPIIGYQRMEPSAVQFQTDTPLSYNFVSFGA